MKLFTLLALLFLLTSCNKDKPTQISDEIAVDLDQFYNLLLFNPVPKGEAKPLFCDCKDTLSQTQIFSVSNGGEKVWRESGSQTLIQFICPDKTKEKYQEYEAIVSITDTDGEVGYIRQSVFIPESMMGDLQVHEYTDDLGVVTENWSIEAIATDKFQLVNGEKKVLLVVKKKA